MAAEVAQYEVPRPGVGSDQKDLEPHTRNVAGDRVRDGHRRKRAGDLSGDLKSQIVTSSCGVAVEALSKLPSRDEQGHGATLRNLRNERRRLTACHTDDASQGFDEDRSHFKSLEVPGREHEHPHGRETDSCQGRGPVPDPAILC